MKHQDIICISMTTWEGDYMKTIVHMMSQLAKKNRVLFVDYAFTWKDVLFSLIGKSKAPVKRMLGLKPRLRRIKTRGGDDLYHLTLPPVIPINWIKKGLLFDWLLRIQVLPVEGALTKTIKLLDFDRPLMINAFHPVLGEALYGKLDVAATIYYCYDEIRAAHWAGTHGGEYENKFIGKADGVVVTSEGLYQNRVSLNDNVAFIKNGVDFELFHRAFQRDKTYDNPVIGYLGSIDDRLDYDLLEGLIRKQADWDFHFVGRVTNPGGKERLSTYSNVRFFGAKQPDEISLYLRPFDVGIIPFVKNEFTQNIYPLKINEYLAAGKPVVSTHFADLSDFQGIVQLADDAYAFIEQINLSLVDQHKSLIEKRISIARSNGWESRSEQFEQLIESVKQKDSVYA